MTEGTAVRVLYNGVTLLKPKTGVAHTAANLHAALKTNFPADTFWLYPGERVARRAGRFFKPPRVLSAAPKEPGLLKRVASNTARAVAKFGYAAHFQTVARLGRFDLYHEPNFVPFRTGLPSVVTVHDLSVILFPEWHPADRVRFHERRFHRGIASAAHILVVSESVRREVIDVLGVSPDRVTTAYNGIAGAYRPQPPDAVRAIRAKHNLPPRYTLYVGTIEPRKNVGTLLRAFCDLPAELREACPLVLAGGWGWKADAERELFHSEGRRKGALHIGYVADDDLPALYAGADALLYPSFYEGFGLPPIEALACSTAAITSTAGAVREVIGSCAPTLDPNDLAGWRDNLARIAREPEFLDDYRRRGPAHAATFTWDSCARTVYGVYRKVLGLSQPEVQLPRAAA